jgi:cupin 2 domain-containing protein
MIRQNLFHPLPDSSPDEVVEQLLSGSEFRLEKIVSTGQSTPPGEWYDQSESEWVALLAGGAKVLFEGNDVPLEMRPGDWINIPAHRRHRVEWTDPEQPTVWLAVHYGAAEK